MSIFDAVKAPDVLEDAVIITLRKWFPTYLTEYELQAGLIATRDDPLNHPEPGSFIKANELGKETGDQYPCIVTICPGLAPGMKPKQEGDGSFRAFFALAVGALVPAQDREDTMNVVKTYVAVARTILLQKQSLGGVCDGMEWVGETYGDKFSFEDQQTIDAGQTIFVAEISGFVNRFGGPSAPDPSPDMPGSEWPPANTVVVNVGRMDS